MYGNGLVEFGEFGGVSMDRTTVMLTDQIRKRVCHALLVALQIHGHFCLAL